MMTDLELIKKTANRIYPTHLKESDGGSFSWTSMLPTDAKKKLIDSQSHVEKNNAGTRSLTHKLKDGGVLEFNLTKQGKNHIAVAKYQNKGKVYSAIHSHEDPKEALTTAYGSVGRRIVKEEFEPLLVEKMAKRIEKKTGKVSDKKEKIDVNPTDPESVVKEDSLNELSQKALGRYVQSAMHDRAWKAHEIGYINGVATTVGTTPAEREERDELNKKNMKRQNGIYKALKKIAPAAMKEDLQESAKISPSEDHDFEATIHSHPMMQKHGIDTKTGRFDHRDKAGLPSDYYRHHTFTHDSGDQNERQHMRVYMNNDAGKYSAHVEHEHYRHDKHEYPSFKMNVHRGFSDPGKETIMPARPYRQLESKRGMGDGQGSSHKEALDNAFQNMKYRKSAGFNEEVLNESTKKDIAKKDNQIKGFEDIVKQYPKHQVYKDTLAKLKKERAELADKIGRKSKLHEDKYDDTPAGVLANLDYHHGREIYHRQAAEKAHRTAATHALGSEKYNLHKAVARGSEAVAAHHAKAIVDLHKRFSHVNEEQLNELSPRVLGSYIHSASIDGRAENYVAGSQHAIGRMAGTNNKPDEHYMKQGDKAQAKSKKRHEGIVRATNKLVAKAMKESLDDNHPHMKAYYAATKATDEIHLRGIRYRMHNDIKQPEHKQKYDELNSEYHRLKDLEQNAYEKVSGKLLAHHLAPGLVKESVEDHFKKIPEGLEWEQFSDGGIHGRTRGYRSKDGDWKVIPHHSTIRGKLGNTRLRDPSKTRNNFSVAVHHKDQLLGYKTFGSVVGEDHLKIADKKEKMMKALRKKIPNASDYHMNY